MAGASIVHFWTPPSKSAAAPTGWKGGGAVLNASSAQGFDSLGVFSPGVAANALNGTWTLFYAGASHAAPGTWSIGAATATSAGGPFTRAYGGKPAIAAGAAPGNSKAKYTAEVGAIPAGGDLFSLNTTIADAEVRCSANALCRGFTFDTPAANAANDPGSTHHVYFKAMSTVVPDATWRSYLKPAVAPTMPNATKLLHPRPIYRGGRASSARAGAVAVTALDKHGDGSLNMFGVGRNYEWTTDFLLPFESNPLLGTGTVPSFGRPGLAVGSGGVSSVEYFHGPDLLLHAVGCAASPAVAAGGLGAAPVGCHHYVSGADKGESVGVQWYGPIGGPLPGWPAAVVAPVILNPEGGYPGNAATRGDAAAASRHGGAAPAGTTAVAVASVGGVLHAANVSWAAVGPPLPSSTAPRHIHLAAANSTSLSVMWATWNATTESIAEFCSSRHAAARRPDTWSRSRDGLLTSLDGCGGVATTSSSGDSYKFLMDPTKPQGTAQWQHVATLAALKPGASYRYRVGSTVAGEGWSRWIQFTMPGAAGATSFLALADLGADETVGGQTTAFMRRELDDGPGAMLPAHVGDLPQFAAVIHAGDFACARISFCCHPWLVCATRQHLGPPCGATFTSPRGSRMCSRVCADRLHNAWRVCLYCRPGVHRAQVCTAPWRCAGPVGCDGLSEVLPLVPCAAR